MTRLYPLILSFCIAVGSRIPQICEMTWNVLISLPLNQNSVKNLVTKCAGLSPVLFLFAIAGNATYVASILVVSTETKYLAVNASWLAGTSYFANINTYIYHILVQVAD